MRRGNESVEWMQKFAIAFAVKDGKETMDYEFDLLAIFLLLPLDTKSVGPMLRMDGDAFMLTMLVEPAFASRHLEC